MASKLMIPATLLITITSATPVRALGPSPRSAETTMEVQLDFIDRQRKSVGWLEGELARRGYARCSGCKKAGHFTVHNKRLTTSDPAVARYANRIRAFLSFHGSTNRPYFDLMLQDPTGRQARCVTTSPLQILGQFRRTDFDKSVFLVDRLDTPAIRACRVQQPASRPPYQGLSRAAFLKAYFGKHKELLIGKHGKLGRDPHFLLVAINHGFYAFSGCVSGYLQLR